MFNLIRLSYIYIYYFFEFFDIYTYSTNDLVVFLDCADDVSQSIIL